MTFEVRKDKFYRDGKEIKLMSGAVHYFRNMPDTWSDIFKKLRAVGCNCVETYCAWNMHERHPGEFNFDGILDIAEFIKKAQSEGLMVIVRPGPYICAEWEFGGLPWWIQSLPDMEIRCTNPVYIKHFKEYLHQLFKRIKPLLCTNGGPVIMMQCENEYGYYGDDKEYLKLLYEYYRSEGIDVPLFTSDGPAENILIDGYIDGCIPTLNFGSRVEENFEAHDRHFPDSPKMCMEMWNGWFDAWGDPEHHTTSVEDYTKVLREMLNKGSFNMYMFIGGTNFGFFNGANHGDEYTPKITSYDYDALLTECGDITPKYLAVREVLQEFTKEELPQIPPNRPKKAYGKVELTEFSSLFENIEKISLPIRSHVPKCMEEYGEGYGYIAYRTKLNRDYKDALLTLEDIGDRAHIYINEELKGIMYINDEKYELNISANAGDILTILCENLGRTNYGYKMMRKKGIIGRCLIDYKVHFNWDVYTLPMDNLEKVSYSSEMPKTESMFLKGEFSVDETADTFLDFSNFTKGFVVINGFNIGRYWEIGPQKTLYVPASVLKHGKNEIVIFESDGVKGELVIELSDKHILG